MSEHTPDPTVTSSLDPMRLPEGVSYCQRPDRPRRPHKFGAWDDVQKRYRWKSFADKAKGLMWAKEQWRAFQRGEATTVRARLVDISEIYIERLIIKGSHPRYVAQVRALIAQLLDRGIVDLSSDKFPDQVQKWLNNMRNNRQGYEGEKPPAAPATKRRCLTMLRCIVNFALKLPSRPLRFNPLMCVVTPRVDRKEKPVFTIPELRKILSEESRNPGRTLREKTEAAVKSASGSIEEAAKALGCHPSTVRNRLATEDREDGWWLFAALGIYTGARASEIQSMEWQWIRWEEQVILLPASCPGNKMRLDRIIPLQPELKDILVSIYHVGKQGFILDHHQATVAATDRSYQFQLYVRRCGVEMAGRGPHSLRHNHAAIAAAQQVNLADIMRRLGHENMGVSLSYSRTASRFHLAVRGWGSERFYLRDHPPVSFARSIPSALEYEDLQSIKSE